MKTIVLLLVFMLSIQSGFCIGRKHKKGGMNYKKIHKTHKKYKKRNIYECKNYTFKK